VVDEGERTGHSRRSLGGQGVAYILSSSCGVPVTLATRPRQ
jgi:hypothetical protein